MLKIVYFPHRLVLQTRPILMFFLTPLRRALGSATCDAACIASNDRRRRQCCGRAVGPADVTAEGISESLPNESGFLKIIPPKSFKKKTSFVLWKASPTCPRALEHHKSLVAPKDPSHQKWTIVLSWSLLQLSRGVISAHWTGEMTKDLASWISIKGGTQKCKKKHANACTTWFLQVLAYLSKLLLSTSSDTQKDKHAANEFLHLQNAHTSATVTTLTTTTTSTIRSPSPPYWSRQECWYQLPQPQC